MEIKNNFTSRKDKKKHEKKNGLFSLFNLFSFGGNKKEDKPLDSPTITVQEEEKEQNIPLLSETEPESAVTSSSVFSETKEGEVTATVQVFAENEEKDVAVISPVLSVNEKDVNEKDITENGKDSLPQNETVLKENISEEIGEGYTLGNSEYTSRKNKKKFVRAIFQFIILGFVGYAFVALFLTMTVYQPYNSQADNLSRDKGFIALSYIGTQRITTHNLFGLDLLRQHLKALKDMGYVTITQQDVIDYYQSGKALPEKALFLMFEDARRNTVIFSQKILEELNFKATMLTYPERFLLKDDRFLKPDEIADLEKTTFWELGSNGYRYAFINVFDRYDHYFSEMNLFEHTGVAPYLELHLPKKRQNHYLMDYIRDRHGIPQETHDDMRERISYDYKAIHDVYTQKVKVMPQLYVLLHPNTGKFGDNEDVSAVNEYWIKELFKMNFNRAGSCVNKPGDSIYDLTRMQPQAWWSVNHLLVKLKYDLKQDLEFITGYQEKLKNWHILKGAAEFQEKTIILTSFPRDVSRVKLKDSSGFQDVHVSAKLLGNKLGTQKMYLRADDSLSRFLAVYIMDNYLHITEKNGGAEKELFKLNLDRHDGKAPWSVPEDKKMAELSELEAFMKYAPSKDKAKIYAEQIKEKTLEVVPTIEDGAPEYVPIITADARGNRELLVSLRGDILNISIDGKEAVKDLQVANVRAGVFYLESGWSGKFWADEVYDGVFEDLVITENTGIEKKKETVLFDVRPRGMEGLKFEAGVIWGRIVEFFISKI